tara:strand:- start:1236 stop:1787 length:552 start_codon:yes stop_codon:yes gene_type:complete
MTIGARDFLGRAKLLAAINAILSMSNGTQMRWVKAITYSAQMVKYQPLRDSADKQLIGDPMDAPHGSCSSAHSQYPIPIAIKLASPQPTARFTDHPTVNKTLMQRLYRSAQAVYYARTTIAIPSLIMFITPSALLDPCRAFGDRAYRVSHAGSIHDSSRRGNFTWDNVFKEHWLTKVPGLVRV